MWPMGSSNGTVPWKEIDFKVVLFVPPNSPHILYKGYYNDESNLKLYFRQIFISDEFDELLFKCLNF
ncbi:hypothetical protein HHK36_029206 [Tetracentron sinense]|uniref:Uncharacterized protein n=1 Tax=Tetracentron sinense TaxID=13715 RepID=A0A834YH62_TETSI|nr:hypothetical protein HHK36_029206 [Tetracentron sinense]